MNPKFTQATNMHIAPGQLVLFSTGGYGCVINGNTERSLVSYSSNGQTQQDWFDHSMLQVADVTYREWFNARMGIER